MGVGILDHVEEGGFGDVRERDRSCLDADWRGWWCNYFSHTWGSGIDRLQRPSKLQRGRGEEEAQLRLLKLTDSKLAASLLMCLARVSLSAFGDLTDLSIPICSQMRSEWEEGVM